MYKVLRPTKDAYITNRVINGEFQVSGNVGGAGSLDLFKVYGLTTSTVGTGSVPNTELSRLLIKFDLADLQEKVAAGTVDIASPTFNCTLQLHDVYGGQPTPSNFDVHVYPLSASFDEGLGRDVVFYADEDVCNWLSGSVTQGAWHVSGCGLGLGSTLPCDYITASTMIPGSLLATQTFVEGTEDLQVNVTKIVSATLSGLIPDQGFRISFSPSHETDTRSYFVKRFASRTAFNNDLRPKLNVRFDDSIQDDTNNLYIDSTSYLFIYNYARGALANITSGSTVITGSNSLMLEMRTPVSGGTLSLFFTGSQHALGSNWQAGIYSASVTIPSTNAQLNVQLQASGSITFTPIWQTLNGSASYFTGSTIKAWPAQRGPQSLATRQFIVSTFGMLAPLRNVDHPTVRVHIFDDTSPLVITATRLPVEIPGTVIRDVHYQIRDVQTNRAAVPFDTTYNSTRLSNDNMGMYFKLDASNLTVGRTYVVDVLIITADGQQVYRATCAPFKVDAVP